MAKCTSCGSPLCKGCGSPATFVDPTMTSVGIEPQMTYQPPMPANQMGTAKPMFNPAVQASAEAIYGTPEQRQMSMPGAPVFLKDVPEGDKGAGLRKLPNSVVEQMGYDSATKMVSPLNQDGPGLKKALEIGANILTGGAYKAAKNLLDGNNQKQEKFLPTKIKTSMPKKRANGGHPGYVVDLRGNRIPTETITEKKFKQR